MSEAVEADFVIVGSGVGALCAALVQHDLGKRPLILEKTDKFGGSTAMGGGIMWIPASGPQLAAGVPDSFEKGRQYMNALIGAAPGSSPARKEAYLRTGPRLIEYLQSKGVPFEFCDGWSDYHDELPGGMPRGRSVSAKMFDVRRLGAWAPLMRRGAPVPLRATEIRTFLLAGRTFAGKRTAARVAARVAFMKATGKEFVTSGAALQARLARKLLDRGVELQLNSPVVDLVEEGGRIVGVVAECDGRSTVIRSRGGVLIAAGGFARNPLMRRQYGPQPSSIEWTNANPGDTGEMIECARRRGAGLAQMEEAIWLLSSLPPGAAKPFSHAIELAKPHSMVVNAAGERFMDEAGSYMETGQRVYAQGAVPCWAILESRHRQRYFWGRVAPGMTPSAWLSSGYMKKADTLEDLARQCGVDPAGLRRSVERFNAAAATGLDPDFRRGGRAYDRFYGDPTHRPNPCLGSIEKAPFYAVALYPGDVGTFGGIMTDEHARVIRDDGSVIAGLYATGNSTASVMGRKYPGAGASVGASAVWGYVAARHAAGAAGDA
ncbi:MAG: FAD-dependent oxidoreductase [Caulobacteraceae bacterium]|nr:FAD-dependent oxidoreductase [Caulobacteraceae bacterium]